jgi:putative membrane protein
MNRIIPVTIGALLASVLPASAQQDWGPWRMHEWMGWGWGGMWLGPLFMIGWLALLVALVVLVVRWLGGAAPTGARPERTAREILDERYARGEIDREEYQRRRQDIDGR